MPVPMCDFAKLQIGFQQPQTANCPRLRWGKRHAPQHTDGTKRRVSMSGMYVPSDGFGGVSPERKAGEVLQVGKT
jgi:hypothetical protein